MNTPHYVDNLNALRRYIKDESGGLIFEKPLAIRFDSQLGFDAG